MKFQHLIMRNSYTQSVLYLAELKKRSDWLVKELSLCMGIELTPFKRHIVEYESFQTTVQGSINSSRLIDLRVEGDILFKAYKESFPYIEAHMMVFGGGNRLGIRSLQGNCYFVLRYHDSTGWANVGWKKEPHFPRPSVPTSRNSDYDSFEDTWEKSEEFK